MSSLKKRGLILALSRASNQAVLLFSPLLLVRLLDVHQYGQYREFVLYAMVLNAIVHLNASRSLLYFLPLRPEYTRRFVTQAALFTFVLGLLGALLVLGAGDLIRSYTSYDFVLPLALYLFFLVNLEYLESYWLATKRTDLVLYYSTGQLLVRLIVVVGVAWRTRDALAIAYALVALESLRVLLVLIYSWRAGLIRGGIDAASCRAQIGYFLPLGGASILYTLNENLSRLFVSAQLGTVALSLYTIGTYALPLRGIVRSSVSDVIFPDMVVNSDADDPRQRLSLWQRSTLLLCLMMLPLATVLAVYAEVIVDTLFTERYAAAAPVFTVYALVLAWECFDLTLPVRSAGRTGCFVYTNLAGIAVNLVLLYPFYLWFGLSGPALSYLVARLATGAVFAGWILHIYGIRPGELLPWADTARVLLACVLAAPMLYLAPTLPVHPLPAAVLGGLGFGGAYLLLIRLFGSRSTDLLVMQLLRPLRRGAGEAGAGSGIR